MQRPERHPHPEDAADTLEPPEASDFSISLIQEDVRGAVGDILYSKRLGVRSYTVVGESAAVLATWKEEIEQLVLVLKEKNKALVKAAMTNDKKIRGNPKTITKMLNEEVLSEEDMTLLAIGIWILRSMRQWQRGDTFGSGVQLLVGGIHNVADAVNPSVNAPCIDICFLIQQIAKTFGIAGSVYRLGKSSLSHRVWQSTTGKIVDPMYGWKRGGFFASQKAFAAHLAQDKILRERHRDIINP